MLTGYDISRWQDNAETPKCTDFAKMAQTAKFVIIKASQANWKDRDFDYNWKGAKAVGIPRGAYHFLTWDVKPETQAEYFYSLLKNDPPELTYVCDFEWWQTVPSNAKDILWAFLVRIEQLTGRVPMIYTAPGFWAQYGTTAAAWAKYPLWIAHYDVQKPQIPKPWTTYKIWQWGTPAIGLEVGVESKEIDTNWYNGDAAQFAAEFGTTGTTGNNGEQGETMANNWKDKPIGVGLSKDNVLGAAKVDFAVVDMGSADGINDSMGAQLDAAQALGVPVLGVYQVNPALYVERGGTPWEEWNMDTDPYVAHLGWSRYSLDRMIRGVGGTKNKYIHGIILDLRNIKENAGTISPHWWLSTAKYYAEVISKRYKLPWFAFCTAAVVDTLKKAAGNSSIVDFFYNVAETNASLKIAPLDGEYPTADSKPEFIGKGVDFWLYEVGIVAGVTGVASRWIYNGSKAGMNGLLNFTGAVVPTPNDPPDDGGDSGGNNEPVPTGDISLLLSEAKKQTALLERIANHLGVR